jgi:hypothetical protein
MASKEGSNGPIPSRGCNMGLPHSRLRGVVVEMSDDEFLRGAEADGHFAFLEDPSEDVYTWDDGEDL